MKFSKTNNPISYAALRKRQSEKRNKTANNLSELRNRVRWNVVVVDKEDLVEANKEARKKVPPYTKKRNYKRKVI